MATLYPENNEYVPSEGQSSSAFLPGLMKKLQEDVKKSTANNLNQNISSGFTPGYGTPSNVGKNILDKIRQGNTGFNVGTPITTSQDRYESIPSYEKFLPTDTKDINAPRWVSPSDQAKISSLPASVGGGQYVIDKPGDLLKSQRVLVDEKSNPGFKEKLLGGLSSRFFQIDHTIPLWAGGADTTSNLQILDIPTHEIKTNIQAVPLTLLANGKININRARMMALTWKDKDVSNLPNVGENGMYSVDFAEKTAKQWEEQATKPKPVSFKDVYRGIPKAMQEFGKGWLPTPIREFIKQGVSGLTAGIVPAPTSEEAGTISKIAGTTGYIAGTIYGLGKFGKLLGVGKNALFAKNGIALAEDAMKTATLNPISIFTKMRQNATLLALWGQIGLTGREITGQQGTELKNHMTQFLSDAAFGSILGASGQNVRGYTQVGIGTIALSLVEGDDIQTALKNGALMTGLHAMGFKGRFNEINDITYKRSVATLNQYLGDIVPTVKKGQGVPSVLTLDIPAIEKMRQQYQKDNPNDTRITSVSKITNEHEAVDFLTRASLTKYGEIIANSVKKTDIPQEMIDAEIRRIGTAGVQLYNQTLPSELRIQKQMQDVQSIAEQLKPQTTSMQTKQKPPTVSEITKDIPLNFPEQTYENQKGIIFPEGNIPITGYSANIDSVSKGNIESFDKGKGNTSNRIILVNDAKTNSIMRLINYEAMIRGEKQPIAEPEKTLRAYYVEEGPNGKELKPVGYAATAERIGSREYNINKNYDKMMSRIRTIIEKADTPENLMKDLNKDKSKPSVDVETAQNLFDQKKEIKKITDESIISTIKASSPLENIFLNNSPVAEAMIKNNIPFLTGDINKLTKTKTGEPFLVLSIKEKNWLESMATRDGQLKTTLAPVQETIKDITERKKAIDVVEKIKEVKNKVSETPTVDFSPKEKKTMAREMKMSPEKIQEFIQQGKLKKKPVINTYNYQEKLPLSPENKLVSKITSKASQFVKKPIIATQIPPKVIIQPPTRPQDAFKLAESTNIAPTVQNNIVGAKEAIREADRALYRRLSQRMDEIVKKATDEGRMADKPEEKNALNILSKKMVELIKKYKVIKPQTNIKENSSIERNKLLNEALAVAEEDMSSLQVKGYFSGKQKFENSLRGAIKGSESMIKNNKLKLSQNEQKNLENDFRDRVDQMIKEETVIASREYEPTNDFEIQPEYKKEVINKLPQLTQDQQLAKDYGLKLKEDGFLFLDKNREPVWADSNKKGTPLSFFGSFLKKRLEVYNKLKTHLSEEFVKGLDIMAKEGGVYNLFAKTIRESLNEAIVNPQDPWLKKAMGENPGKSYTFNSLMKSNSNYMKNLFETMNMEGRSISQPIKRIVAQVEGKSPEQIKKIDLQTIKAEQESRKIHEEQTSDPFAQKIEGTSPEDLKNMSIRDEFQIEKVQDLTNFELRFPSLIYEDITGKKPPMESVIADGIRFAKDFVSNYNPKIKSEREGGKIKKKFMDKEAWEKIKNKILESSK